MAPAKSPKVQALTTTQAAERLGVTRETVLKWIEAGQMPAWKTPGGHHRIWLAALENFIHKRTV